MDFLLLSIFAGFLATLGMTFLLWLTDRTGWANTNMVRAIGSAITRSYEKSLLPGIIIQFTSGFIFAMIYIYILQTLQISGVFPVVLAGGIIGLAHGFAFSFIMVILAEHHPIEKFQNASFQVAIVHFFAHIVYGALVGLVLSVAG